MTALARKTLSQDNSNLNALSSSNAMASLGVKDITRAKKFYSETLGLETVEDMGEVISYKTGDTTLLVYVSEFAGTNKATAATWNVDNVEGIAKALKDNGVKLEDYKMPRIKRDGDVYRSEDGSMTMAWFKDPDGNILCIVSK